MKIIRTLFLAACILGLAAPLQAGLSQKLDQYLDTMLQRLEGAKQSNDYTTEQFLADIKGISVEFHHERLNPVDSSVSLLKTELILMSHELNKAPNTERLKELQGWYGGYAHEMPDQYLGAYRAQGAKISQMLGGKEQTLEELREKLKNGSRQDQSKAVPYLSPTAELRDEHTAAEYLSPWKFWLMAPPSKERSSMRGHINHALQKINDESVISLLVENFKNEVQRANDQRIKKELATATINLISVMPGKKSLDALLEINRYVAANNLNGDDYYKSTARHIIRRLASRRAYADQLIDPKMKDSIKRQGYNENPEDIPLTDELWKKYKLLLKARLQTITDETPQADIELIKSALEIMPDDQ